MILNKCVPLEHKLYRTLTKKSNSLYQLRLNISKFLPIIVPPRAFASQAAN